MMLSIRLISLTGAIAFLLGMVGMPSSGAHARTACESSRSNDRSSEKPLNLEGPSTGLLTFYRDRRRGRLYLKIPPSSDTAVEIGTFIFLSSLKSGLGSPRFMLTRGRFRQGGEVTIRRIGDRVIIERENSRYVDMRNDASAQRTVKESFPTSIYWIGCVASRRTEDKSEVVDITDFLLRDFGGVARALKRRKEGQFKLDRKLSYVDPAALHVFPDNIEMEGTLSYVSASPGRKVRRTMASPESLTLVQHISIIRRPAPGYSPRDFDPRAGMFHLRQFQFGRRGDKPLEHRYMVRHRLQKTDPAAARSAVRKPIVFYVDSAMPQPYRDATLEGARWWQPAFEKIGLMDAFQVKLLPPHIHPLDARYNVLQLVHRTSTSWSDGLTIRDPRTGEIVRSIISMDSQRIRRHRENYEALVGGGETGTGTRNDPLRAAVARIRWMAAHEVGHALGFRHNFAASAFGNGRESVMDYWDPRIEITPDGGLDLSNAYREGIGRWDYFLVKYAYTEFAAGTDEKAALDAMVRQAEKDGLIFLSDGDAGHRSGLHPMAARHDSGPDPLADLAHRLRVRAISLRRFGPDNLQPDRPLALLRKKFRTLYYYHTNQARNVAKLIGGMNYRHRLSGGADRMEMIESGRQKAAIAALVALAEPGFLDIPDRILEYFPPRTIGYWREPGRTQDTTGRAFDGLGMAAKGAGSIFNALLAPARVSRLVEMSRRNADVPSLEYLLDTVTDSVFRNTAEPQRLAEIRRAIQQSLVHKLQKLSLDESVSETARVRIDSHLARLATRLKSRDGSHAAWLAAQITRQLERPFGSETPMASRDRPGRRGSGFVANDGVDTGGDLWDNEPSVIFSGSAIMWSD